MPNNTPSQQPSLSQLLRRIIWSFTLAILGSWGIIIPRLNIIQLSKEELGSKFWFYTDLISLSIAILGIFLVIYHNSRIAPRLRRLQDLGEDNWGL
ncbi:MAG: hypothetical protein LBE38_08070 [Deltaproteobacteria bacterium]|jgi:hypothetical protein|nr:hypothetical protein [Deltaproteobacteria bacterium]